MQHAVDFHKIILRVLDFCQEFEEDIEDPDTDTEGRTDAVQEYIY